MMWSRQISPPLGGQGGRFLLSSYFICLWWWDTNICHWIAYSYLSIAFKQHEVEKLTDKHRFQSQDPYRAQTIFSGGIPQRLQRVTISDDIQKFSQDSTADANIDTHARWYCLNRRPGWRVHEEHLDILIQNTEQLKIFKRFWSD